MPLAATTPNQQFGKYRLLKKLAQGGMAEIFLAVQQGPQAFEKVVVIKRMLPELCVSFDFVQMFMDEARVAARLDHPNIIRIYDFGDFEGQYYLAMEYVPGEDLASIIQQCKRTRTKIPVDLAVDVMISAAEGLHHAHEMEDGQGNSLGVVHRDVSPSNIICGYQGAVKVLDFGVARAKNNISRTSPGVRKGTPQYFAPEQALGEVVDRRADIFALGLVMHELLTGNRLFQRESEHATISAIIGDDIAPPSLWRPDLPADIDRIVMKAMSRSPAGRYPSALEMAAALSAFLAGAGYVRDAQQMEFLTSLFGEERKKEKQRLALGASAEELASGPNLAPVRDTGTGPLPVERPSTGPGRASDRPGTGGSGAKGGAAAASPRRRSNPQLVVPSIAPLIAPLVPSPAAPIQPVPAPVSSEVPSVHKPMDTGAARPLTPSDTKKAPGASGQRPALQPGTKKAPGSSGVRPAPRPAPQPSRPSAGLGAELFADLELPRSPAPPAPAHAPARTPPPAHSEPPRAEPARPEAPQSPPVRSEPLFSEPPPSAAPVAAPPVAAPSVAAPFGGEPARPEPVQSPAPSSGPLSTEAAPIPAKRRRSPIVFVAAAGLGVGVIGAAFFILGPERQDKVVVIPDPKPGPQADIKPDPKPDIKPDPKPDPKPEPTGLQVGGLKLMNLPPGATATIDGEAILDPSKERYLPAGSHALVVEAKGFLPFKVDVEIAVGQVKQVEVTLQPQPVVPKGTVAINCQPWCQITVDKKDTGKTSPARLVLTAGPHTLLLANPPAGLAKTIQVVVPENEVITKVVKLDE